MHCMENVYSENKTIQKTNKNKANKQKNPTGWIKINASLADPKNE